MGEGGTDLPRRGTEQWWALEAERGPYGREKGKRLVVATTDPEVLPERTTRYLRTNLPAPGSGRAEQSGLAPADVAEVVGLYGLRMWVEQSYKQVKQSLGWAHYQVRKDISIRRHWQMVCSAFSFCWWAYGRPPASADDPTEERPEEDLRAGSAGRQRDAGVLAGSVEGGEGMAGAVGDAHALLEGLLRSAPATGATDAA